MASEKNEELKRRKELYESYKQKFKNREQQVLSHLDEAQREFVQKVNRGVGLGELDSKYAKNLYEGLNAGKYKKPSDFIEEEMDWLFSGYILPRYKECLKWALDNCNRWTYSSSRYRRSFRTEAYYIENMLSLIQKFHNNLCFDRDICDIMCLKLSEEEAAYMQYISWNTLGYNSCSIAYELDQGNERLEEILTDIMNGEGAIPIDRSMILGIAESSNQKMHILLGKLLLAARLQEGLRQSICETMDMGTVSCFLSLLKVIEENNLIRFSSVKRAVGTWLGLIEPESGNLERISDKSVTLIVQCIENREKADEFLKTEDSMKIYIALWAYGFYEAKDAIQKVKELSTSGTHHQILTAGYFCANLDNSGFSYELAKKVIAEHTEEYDILAVYMGYFMNDWNRYIRNEEKKKSLTVEKYFSDRKEAETYYDILLNIYQGMTKKKIEFSPCIFPWYSVEFTKSSIVQKLCVIAKLLKDNEKIDFSCKLIKESDVHSRASLVLYILDQPETKIQKAVLTEALCDKESYTRKTANKLMENVSLETENFLQMEEMLRYKAADMRENLIALLSKQKDEDLRGTVERLLSDKKEEKRTAGLDLVMQMSKNAARKDLYKSCVKYVENIEHPSSKEQILIDNILGSLQGASEDKQDEASLFKDSDAYVPEISDNEYLSGCVSCFMDYFPSSKIKEQLYNEGEKSKQILSGEKGKPCKEIQEVLADCDSLDEIFRLHLEDEFQEYNGEIHTVGDSVRYFREKISDAETEIPLFSVWKNWYEEKLSESVRLYRMYILLAAYSKESDYSLAAKETIEEIYGTGFADYPAYEFNSHLYRIVERLVKDYVDEDTHSKLAVAVAYWYVKCMPQEKVLLPTSLNGRYGLADSFIEAHFIEHAQVAHLFYRLSCRNNEQFPFVFPLAVKTSQKTFAREPKKNQPASASGYYTSTYYNRYQLKMPYTYMDSASGSLGFKRPEVNAYMIAAHMGLISEASMYQFLFEKDNVGQALKTVSLIASGIREQGKQVAKRGNSHIWQLRYKQRALDELLGKTEKNRHSKTTNGEKEVTEEFTEEEKSLFAFVDGVYDTMIHCVLKAELRRGDTETLYSKHIRQIERIYGMENFIAILTALGKDTLERSTYYTSNSKKGCLSHLLSICIPCEDDNADKLKEMLEKTDITEKRLIEAGLYSPEWIEMIGTYLGWEGFRSACYYFMAHMNEKFDDVRKAMIAKYTPLTDEELNAGAFDIQWFQSAYEIMGEKRFNLIYDAAKYISDGSKHSRARKYADAVLGKMDKEATEKAISDKRNKDLVMAYSLIPLAGEDDISSRYLFLQKFLKESKKFGAQRIASEKRAVSVSLGNLAMNAGYADVTRLTLRMETKLIEDSKELFQEKEIEEVTVRLAVDESGKTDIICVKNGKTLKAIPAKLKKNSYIASLIETKKNLTEQFRRTKIMFEQAMEDGTEFAVSEICIIQGNPVVLPIIQDLVFKYGEKLGFLNGNKLVDYAGNETALSPDDQVVVAHPFHLYTDGHWTEFQKNLFDRKAVQSFKQVFRELYVKTEEELELNYSRRYSGNQIQPKKTMACLKSRRWIADVEDGLQKVYYKENIIARIYALADWFSPAEIEAPTLEWVEFSDRKTGEQIRIKDIPDVIFSEVMRDVDMAVSVAHAGGVDPETSHSTIEMRGALLAFTLPLFKLKNVKINKNHAIVDGKYGTYTIHLGSGVIHKQGGTMINVLPVHSQHRGKLFLPFVDDDPKTAEIITKVLFFAEDGKIKDPMILEQIK